MNNDGFSALSKVKSVHPRGDAANRNRSTERGISRGVGGIFARNPKLDAGLYQGFSGE